MIETIPNNSLFLTADKRKKRWAVPYSYESLNCRIENLLIRNREHIENKCILDLGCHFGTFAYASLLKGARHVHGVDSEAQLISQAEELFAAHNISKGKYTFSHNDVIRLLEDLPPDLYDTIFCLGIFYYINDPIYFLRLMKRAARTIILDTFTAYYAAVVSKDGVDIARYTKPETFDLPVIFYPVTQAQKSDYTLTNSFKRIHKKKQLGLLTLPTIRAIENLFDLTGVEYRQLSWEDYKQNDLQWKDFIDIGTKNSSHWADIYHTKIRVSYILHRV